ncbi:MAG: hypothetical protein IT178_10180 [Acidobacteria bacterium]|nr:hypothetical protein [Acidobacteriota bacterium]
MSSPLYLMLEPGRTDTDEGLRARIADPVWFITRQWQMGELQGEDASTPVVVSSTPTHAPVTYDRARPDLDPSIIPAEALLEAEPGGWWTIGRRVRLGRAAEPLLDAAARAAYRLGRLPSPYEHLADAVDGRAVFASGLLAGHAIWSEVPSPAPDRWSSSTLDYSASFEAGGTALRARNHTGGDVDWFTVDGAPGATTLTRAAATPPGREVIPGRLDYPGAPHPRWWQIEDREVDIGGFAPDRSHFATMLLLDVALAHADDWFSFPVPRPASQAGPSSGVLVTLDGVTVRDSFGEVWPLLPPSASGPDAWSLFHSAGLSESQLLIWPVAVAPQAGPILDEILVGVDEDANLAWAVELRADGVQMLPDADTSTAVTETTRTGTRVFRYLPSTTLPNGWHPYERVRDGDPSVPGGGIQTGVANVGLGDGRSGHWRQGVLADLTGAYPRFRPGPVSRLIGGPSGSGLGRGHHLASTAIPSSGVMLRRRAMLARDTNGRPVLWVERSTAPVSGPPVSHLRFDVFAEAARAGGR